MLGTSLCGMNADRMVETPARKHAEGVGLGAVIVGLQRTQYDEVSTLRLYARCDEVCALLALDSTVSSLGSSPERALLHHEAISAARLATFPLAFLARLGDNGVVWNVLSFWRAAN